ncbi:hypothetical protein EA462_12965 [Natrarchaeobius halalkaliphilus]|uniref:Halobacterial output domain-containing protein n=2 Tax=Natrarchaeobius halalkaliphilus TaxID=1679091 RepID=A0A3N6M517_9EURY|nr:hypothetical protein EA462_12965 [Natrarchaeobius halalkaliphilus]
MAVVQRVATATDRPATQLPPLYDAIDPEALDAVFRSGSTGSSEIAIEFRYAGYRVTIDSTGQIEMEQASE